MSNEDTLASIPSPEGNATLRRSPRNVAAAHHEDLEAAQAAAHRQNIAAAQAAAARRQNLAASQASHGRAAPGRGATSKRSSRAGSGQSASRGSGPRFSVPELEFLLDCIKEVHPLGPEEWERVAEAHASGYPENNRDPLSLRRKFQALYNTKIPTGDPKCPKHVREAKRLRYSIEQRADSTNMSDTNGTDLGFIEEDEDTTNNVLEQEGEPPADDVARVLFQQTQRPFTVTRTPSTSSSGGRNVGSQLPVADMAQVLMASMFTRMQREEVEREERNAEREERRIEQEERRKEEQEERRAEREERRIEQEERRKEEREERKMMREQQQLHTAMMMAMVSAINPAAHTIQASTTSNIQGHEANAGNECHNTSKEHEHE